MVRSRLLVVCVAVALAVGCTERRQTARSSEGVLVLEVGGEHGSLRGALLAAGVDANAIAPALRIADATPADAGLAHDESPANGERAPAKPPDQEQGSAEPPRPGVGGEDVVVELGRGETLMQLAKHHLGSSARYREILERNGWSEADARRLRAGQLVKIPPATKPAPR